MRIGRQEVRRVLPTIGLLVLTACTAQSVQDRRVIEATAKVVRPSMRVSDVLQFAESRRGGATAPRVRVEQCEGIAYRILERDAIGYAMLRNERPLYVDSRERLATREAAFELVDRLSVGCRDVAVASGVSAVWMELDAQGRVRAIRKQVHGS